MRYREVLKVIDAVKYDGGDLYKMADWITEAISSGTIVVRFMGTNYTDVCINNSKSRSIAMKGDYIIRANDGTLSVCKSDIFEQIYKKENTAIEETKIVPDEQIENLRDIESNKFISLLIEENTNLKKQLEAIEKDSIEEIRELETIQTKAKLNTVYSVDNVGPGGANHKYVICEKDALEYALDQSIIYSKYGEIQFQKGARHEDTSIHGVIDSDLLEIVRDRLIAFQAGPFSSEDNAKTLEAVELALTHLNKRVEDRINRKVLGFEKK